MSLNKDASIEHQLDTGQQDSASNNLVPTRLRALAIGAQATVEGAGNC